MHVVDDGAPRLQVCGCLVNKLLPVFAVTLIRIVTNELIVIYPVTVSSHEYLILKLTMEINPHEQWLPHRRLSVHWLSHSATSDTTDKRPSHAVIFTRVDIDLGLAQVCRDAVASNKQSASRVASDSNRQLVQERLVSQTPSVDCVLDFTDLSPRRTRVR